AIARAAGQRFCLAGERTGTIRFNAAVKCAPVRMCISRDGREVFMRILAYNCGHDGSVALIEDGGLRFCLESEKDDGIRHLWAIPPPLFVRSLQLPEPPDAIAISGFHRRF